jgi:predicted membrane-bound spermidine synthase
VSRGESRTGAPFTLRLAFGLSGCAALLFETLWFRQAGLVLGNSVWSSSIVLAAFMAGLAVGNLALARRRRRLRRPLRVYVALEVVIAFTGLALVLLFPLLARLLPPLLAAWVDDPAALNTARLGLTFVLMLVPASAMGATLPVLVAALSRDEAGFGPALGRLYAWNTLGAVVGALAGELALIESFGLTGCGGVAAALNLSAALAARRVAPRIEAQAAAPGPHAEPLPALGADAAATQSAAAPAGAAALALLVAAFLSGAILLALEVFWFRFLLLFVHGTSAAFAVMLAAVLVGIAAGGWAGSLWLSRRPGGERALPLVALAAGASVAWSYAGLRLWRDGSPAPLLLNATAVAAPTLALALAPCLLSGLLFTLLGHALRRRLEGEARVAGLLTLANTLGAMSGALLGGLVLLPAAGLERGFLALACAYAAVALLSFAGTRRAPSPTAAWRRPAFAAIGAYALTLALFPFGAMERAFLPSVVLKFGPLDSVVARRETLTETVTYLRSTRWDRPLWYRLVTNGHSMSSNDWRSARYMRLFSYLPLALRPEARSALVISFGLGSTVEALAESPALRSIDVVDVSRDILELGRVVYPAPRRYPIDDPRVRTHVEDGRFFLMATRRTFDVITGEPPPPKSAGIVGLYTREYFELLRARLAPGGLATYWLPVMQLTQNDARAVLRAFCDAFADCTLWTGSGLEWIMAGTRGATAPSEGGFAALWSRPGSREALTAIGLGVPAQLGTTFLADAEQLRPWIGGARPLVDDYPLRLSSGSAVLPDENLVYAPLLVPEGARQRFAESAWVRRTWPPETRAATLAQFERETPVLRFLAALAGLGAAGLPELGAVAGKQELRTATLWLLGSSTALEQAAQAARQEGRDDPDLPMVEALSAFADGRYLEAEAAWHAAQRRLLDEAVVQRRILALSLAGESERARRLMLEAGDWVQPQDRRGWQYLITRFGLPDPWGLTASDERQATAPRQGQAGRARPSAASVVSGPDRRGRRAAAAGGLTLAARTVSMACTRGPITIGDRRHHPGPPCVHAPAGEASRRYPRPADDPQGLRARAPGAARRARRGGDRRRARSRGRARLRG